MNTPNTTYIKDITAITGKTNIDSGLTMSKKLKMVSRHINPSRYDFLGFLDRTNTAVLRPRFHNVRDSLGRFAAVVE
ncbi:MAG: hypothetical protein EBW87_06200 [Burkholderiaceae bacterium]|jgi:hypothetical protein|nr:hypothetical protein [Burkholderiaceae bacterium]